MSVETLLFHSPSKGPLRFSEVIASIAMYMEGDPHREYKIIVGTDSSARSSTSLVTAVIVHRVRSGAIYFLTRSPLRTFPSLRDRIFEEAMTSIMLAQEFRSRLRDVLDNKLLWNGDEIHVDIGERGPTKDLIEAVTGIIKGYQFVPIIKPYSFGASTVADRHTH
ncbi:MAG: ribonuclease H-like YkuK family protein [bacterium]|nr:ribonuclease H-like YkuK family protein [bacterium]